VTSRLFPLFSGRTAQLGSQAGCLAAFASTPIFLIATIIVGLREAGRYWVDGSNVQVMRLGNDASKPNIGADFDFHGAEMCPQTSR
jgi:hypothetical protein